jgi:cytochrome c-type biogenesis protein
MEKLLGDLSHAVEGAPTLALGASFVWGVLSVILSPCHLASIPLVVGFISGQGRISTARAGMIATLFAAGILVTIAAIGAITATAGRMLGDIGSWGNYLVAGLFVLVGLNLLGWLPDAWSAPAQTGLKRRGLLAAFVLGLVFGIALGPCTFAFMAPMLGVTFRLAGSMPLYGAALLLAYGIGHCGVIALAGTSTELVQHLLNWNEQSRGLTWLKRVCGVLVILGGAYLIYAAN